MSGPQATAVEDEAKLEAPARDSELPSRPRLNASSTTGSTSGRTPRCWPATVQLSSLKPIADRPRGHRRELVGEGGTSLVLRHPADCTPSARTPGYIFPYMNLHGGDAANHEQEEEAEEGADGDPPGSPSAWTRESQPRLWPTRAWIPVASRPKLAFPRSVTRLSQADLIIRNAGPDGQWDRRYTCVANRLSRPDTQLHRESHQHRFSC